MRIIISDIENGEINVEFEKNFNEDKKTTFPDVYARLMAALEGAVNSFIGTVPASDQNAFKEHLFDILDIGFGNFLHKVFPEVDSDEFDLSAAAIVYAQDQIINKAEAEGKSYKEMLEEYEALADDYIQKKRLN